ncbi:hypothetical protein [Escherichia coli]|nr:hypothetical protein [Escherichia coli]
MVNTDITSPYANSYASEEDLASFGVAKTTEEITFTAPSGE